jgi:hypothetical protein
MPVHRNTDNLLEVLLPVCLELGDNKLDSLVGTWLVLVWLILFLDKVKKLGCISDCDGDCPAIFLGEGNRDPCIDILFLLVSAGIPSFQLSLLIHLTAVVTRHADDIRAPAAGVKLRTGDDRTLKHL